MQQTVQPALQQALQSQGNLRFHICDIPKKILDYAEDRQRPFKNAAQLNVQRAARLAYSAEEQGMFSFPRAASCCFRIGFRKAIIPGVQKNGGRPIQPVRKAFAVGVEIRN